MASTSNAHGSFVLMLHSHLPFYRKAGMWPFGEENLYECMLETYLPLLNMLNELWDEGVPARITVGITPILAEQLADSHLQQGFIDYLDTRIAAVEKDVVRYPDETLPDSDRLGYLASYYLELFQSVKRDFIEKYHRDLVGAFKALQDAGCIEITTSAATHGFLPLQGNDTSIQAQLKTGVSAYKRHFGRAPKGIWLPECAYRPAKNGQKPIESFLFDEELEYFFTEYHAIEGSASSDFRRVIGIYDGVVEYVPMDRVSGPTGLTTNEAYWLKNYPVAVMGRNNRASFQVWSASHGYPGDGLYREFHRKDENSGMHYWRLTSKDCDLGDKQYYDPVQATSQTKFHADHFVTLIQELAEEHHQLTGKHALLMVSFDTELFGHWWFEGVTWLKHVIRGLHEKADIDVETSGEYLQLHPAEAAIDLPESTWGQGGHYWVWNNNHTEWMWPLIHQAEARMTQLADTYSDETDPLKIRVLNQALRELHLLESSDWPFLVTTFQAKDYAIERFTEHHDNFQELAAMLEDNTLDEGRLIALEEKNNPFPTIDYHWASSVSHHSRPQVASLS